MNERREDPRAEVLIEVVVGHSRRPASIGTLSRGGCTLLLPPDEWSEVNEVQLLFQLPGKSEKLCLNGVVKWRKPDMVGIQFLECTLSQQVELEAFVLKHGEKSLQEARLGLWASADPPSKDIEPHFVGRGSRQH